MSPFLRAPPSLLYTDVSLTGWGSHLEDITRRETLSPEEKEPILNISEMEAVLLVLNAFLDRVLGGAFVLISDIATLVVYLKKQRAQYF